MFPSPPGIQTLSLPEFWDAHYMRRLTPVKDYKPKLIDRFQVPGSGLKGYNFLNLV